MRSCPPIIKIKRGAFVPLRENLIFFISFKGNGRLNERLSVRVHGVVGVWLVHGMTKLAS